MALDRADASDEELVRRYQQGSPVALEVLWARHQRDVYALALHWLGDRDLAEDAVAEIAERAVRDLRVFRSRATFGTWLYRVSINLCRKQLAKRRRQPKEMPLDRLVLVEAETPERILEREAVREGVVKLLAQLTPPQRRCLLLLYLRGYTYQEISAATGMPVSTVKSHACRGLLKLRELAQQLLEKL
jgi:RNA polymerase sigma-70 factor, ECF subfamily